MPRESVDFLRDAVSRAGASASTGDFEALADLYHRDVEVRDLRPPPDVPEITRGRAEMFDVWRRWSELFDAWSFEVERFVEADPWVVCEVHWRAVGKGSDVPVEWRVADAYEVRDEKIVRSIHNYADVAAALADLATLKAVKGSQN